MSRQMGRRKTTTKIDYLTATPAIIVADAVAKLSFLPKWHLLRRKVNLLPMQTVIVMMIAGAELRRS